jgi:hypothetical protein
MERKPLRNNGMITKNEYVGKTIQQASQYAEEGGFTTRVVEVDGKSIMLDYNVNDRRLNFRVSNNIVTDVFGG